MKNTSVFLMGEILVKLCIDYGGQGLKTPRCYIEFWNNYKSWVVLRQVNLLGSMG